MKTKQIITLCAVAAAVVAIASCGDGNVKQCVDKRTNKITADSCCNTTHHHTGGGGFYAWYYGNRMLSPGSTASGGSFTPKNGTTYTPAEHGTSRGGFGKTSTGRSSGT